MTPQIGKPAGSGHEQQATAQQLTPRYPFVWLLEIDVPTDPPITYRLVRNPTSVTYRSITYAPGSFEISSIKADSEGLLSSFSVSASNVNREPEAALQIHAGLVESKVRAFLVNVNELTANPYLELRGEVADSSSNERTATLRVGQQFIQERNFPSQRVDRKYCVRAYGDTLCGYDTRRTGAFQTCSKLRDGPNGCIEHGDDEEAASLPRLHPLRFGALPGIRRGPRVG